VTRLLHPTFRGSFLASIRFFISSLISSYFSYTIAINPTLLRNQAINISGPKEEGIEIGLRKGKMETAKAMLAMSIDIEAICKATGLDMRDFKDE
jgi:hypothetical protein